ncbi:MAG: Fic family protein [Candidatus Saganbacteria bacterium]|nr:Fic family protein [Candidatus Saganbacteria bacterium]
MGYKPIYRITPHLLNLIDEASKLHSWIDLAPLQVAWLPILQRDARERSAHSSTSIEGNPLTLPQVRAIDRGEKIGALQFQEKEVVNYLKVMQWIAKKPQSNINQKNLLYLHKLLMQDLLPESKIGKYKEKPNYIINGRGIRIDTPPSPAETPKLMKELFDWINLKETINLHSVIVCAIFHHRFVFIHPFIDGNGRIARVMETLILYQRGFDTHHIFSLDDFFAKDRNRYYLKIRQAKELDNNLTYWIEYVAEGIVSTLKQTKKRIEDLQVSSTSKISISPRQEEVLRILRDKSPISGAELIKQLKITRSRLNQILTPLIKNRLVTKEGQSRATRYKLSLQ